MKYIPKEFSRNADNKISIDVEFIDDVTGVTIKKTFDFDNSLTNAQMNVEVKTQAPEQEEFDALKEEKDAVDAVETRVEQLKTQFLNKEFTV